jgi:hypothetical protein
MKKLVTLLALAGMTTLSFGQGKVNFSNSSTTLISAGGVSMPNAATSQFNFAVFLAPSDTVTATGQSRPVTDAAFQVQGGGLNQNHATAAGRLGILNNFDVGSSAGATHDFIVRGWSANAGATWAAALATWNNGNPAVDMWLGQSTIGNNLVLGDGGALPSTTLFGAGPTQVGGFSMTFFPAIPEPSSMALAGLGAAALMIFRRRK